jgi:glycosyltransferase involved in cell wall biosynthesis
VAGEDVTQYKLLSVVIPVFNERNTVGEVVRRARGVPLPVDAEIIIVDDGSTDGTDKILSALADSTVRVLTHPSNRGKGACIRTALERARGDLVLIQDADLEYDPSDWPRLLEPVLRGRAQVVYGSRFIGERQTMPLSSYAGNRMLSLVADVLFNTNLSDVETGFKLFDRRVLDDLPIRSDGFEFEPEITAKVLRRGYPVYEVPVAFAGRPVEEGRKFRGKDVARALATLVRYRFRAEDGW